MKTHAFETIDTQELARVGGGYGLRHELWQLNSSLNTAVQSQQSSSSSESTMMCMAAMCMAMRR
ncbi:MAG TPA: hypothetical protein VLX92_07985 [Kofleriaceae bacterium]|nr:hypothetical protein [Kofleriaceae bacterium]